jgi:hypothetical protein
LGIAPVEFGQVAERIVAVGAGDFAHADILQSIMLSVTELWRCKWLPFLTNPN